MAREQISPYLERIDHCHWARALLPPAFPERGCAFAPKPLSDIMSIHNSSIIIMAIISEGRISGTVFIFSTQAFEVGLT